MKMISTLVSTHLACNFFILSFSVFHLNVSVKIVIARTWWKSVINRSHDSFSIQKGLIYLSEIYSLTSRVHVFSVLMEIKPCSKLQSASPSYCERGLHILLTSMKIYDNTFLWWTQLLISTWKSHIIFILFHFMTSFSSTAMEGSPIVSEYTSGIFEKVFCRQIWPLFNSYTYPLHREVDFVKALWKIYWLSLTCTDSFPNETSLLIIVEWARKPCVRALCLLNDKDERMVDFCIFSVHGCARNCFSEVKLRF